MTKQVLIALDVGEKRIGVAVADTGVRIAVPFTTIEVDGAEIQSIAEIVAKEQAEIVVVGYPRNQQGESTAQTNYVEKFAEGLEFLDAKLVFQDESLTSVLAEERLKQYGRPYSKGDIDAQAATIILQDYLERNYG
jgi:putative Holliday junction resolvase